MNPRGEWLAGDRDHLTRHDHRKTLEKFRYERPEILNAVSDPNNRNDSDSDFLDVLLKLDAGVVRDKDLEPGFDGSAQENAVSEAEPALSTNGRCLVLGKLRREWSWKTLINENSQRTWSPLRAPALRRPVPC
jgi:hypothetical protein